MPYLPQYLSVLRAAMDTLDKVQQGAQGAAAADKA